MRRVQLAAAMLTEAERKFVERIRAREKTLAEESQRNKRPGQLYHYHLIANANQFPPFAEQARQMIEDHGFVVLPARRRPRLTPASPSSPPETSCWIAGCASAPTSRAIPPTRWARCPI